MKKQLAIYAPSNSENSTRAVCRLKNAQATPILPEATPSLMKSLSLIIFRAEDEALYHVTSSVRVSRLLLFR